MAVETDRTLLLQSDKSLTTNNLIDNIIQVAGSVHFASGKVATGIFVWAECFPHGEMCRMFLESRDGENRIDSSKTKTDEEGNFVVSFPSNKMEFLVKAVAKGYLPAATGSWLCANAPVNPLELVIKDDGGRIAGTFSTVDGNPLTNVAAEYLIVENLGGYGCNLSLEIDADGSFISEPLPVGHHEIQFNSFGLGSQRKDITIAKETLTSIDVIFNPILFNIITGIVVDATYTTPVENVQVTLDSYYRGKTNSPITDKNGIFWIKTELGSAKIHLSHSNYAPFTQLIFFDNTPHPILYMSHAATVIARVYDCNGLEETNCEAFVESVLPSDNVVGTYCVFGKKNDNVTIITNVPALLAPYHVVVRQPSSTRYASLALSEQFTLKEGETKEVDIFLEPPTWLEIDFTHTVNTENVFIEIHNIDKNIKDYYTFWKNSFQVDGIQWCKYLSFNPLKLKSERENVSGKNWRARMVPGKYRVSVRHFNDNVLDTNIVLTSWETSYLPVAVRNPDWNGVIEGEVNDLRGNPLECYTTAWLTGITDENPFGSYNPKTVSKSFLENRERWKKTKHYYSCISDSHKFRIERLNPDDRYDLEVSIRGAHTNLFLKAIAPNGPLLKLIAPNMYRVTGRIIDENGTPLHVKTWIDSREFESVGELVFPPLLAGTHKLSIMPKNHVWMIKEITITDDDVDLGEIIAKKGITVSGRVVDQSGKPVSRCNIHFSSKKKTLWLFGRTDANGKFVQRGLPPDQHIELNISNSPYDDYKMRLRKTIGPFEQEDVNLGDIEIKISD